MGELDPERWFDDPNAPGSLSEDLAGARRAGPSPASRARIEAGLAAFLGPGGSTPPPAPTLPAPAPPPFAAVPFATMAASLGAAGVAVAGIALWMSYASPSAPVGPAASLATPAPVGVVSSSGPVDRASDARPVAEGVPTEGVPTEGVRTEAVRTEAVRTEAVRTEAGATAFEPTPSRVVGGRVDTSPSEVALLEEARRELRRSPARALRLLTRAERLYPDGVFAEERGALAIEARVASGDVQRARSAATRFRSAYPRSAYLTRIETLLAAEPAAP